MTVYASIKDLQRAAQRRVPKAFYDYLENGSFTEKTLAANRTDLDAVKLHQHLLNVAPVKNTETQIFGDTVAMPLVLSPVGLSGMNRSRGEIMAARAARDFNVPYTLSTFSIASIEDIARAVGGAFWYQLYPMQDDKINESLIARAKKAGCGVLVVTIDAQIEGTRYNDLHNGLGIPPKMTPANIWSIATHPLWALRMLRSPHWTFGNMIGETCSSGLSDLANWVKSALRKELDGAFLKWARNRWEGKMIVKGVLSAEDFSIACDAGADGIVISNHGGRQLEGALSTVRVLPKLLAEAHPGVEIYVDGGVRTGIDVLRFLGLGAKACFIGRAYNYGLAADGERGVTTTLRILQDELLRTMAMTGVASLEDLPPNLIQSAPTVTSDN